MLLALVTIVFLDTFYPLAEDRFRFPDYSTTRAQLAFNRAFRAHVETLHQHPSQWEILEEAQELYRIWDLLDDTYYYADKCEARVRRALFDLRAIIGQARYDRAWLPCTVPFHRLTQLQ